MGLQSALCPEITIHGRQLQSSSNGKQARVEQENQGTAQEDSIGFSMGLKSHHHFQRAHAHLGVGCPRGKVDQVFLRH